jgi:hypothetical protein
MFHHSSIKYMMAQDHLRGNPPKILSYSTAKTVLLWHRAEAPRNLLLSQRCHQFYWVSQFLHPNCYYNPNAVTNLLWRKMPLRIFYLFCLTVATKFIIAQGRGSQKPSTIPTLSPLHYGGKYVYEFVTYSTLPLPPTCCTPDGGRWLYTHPVRRLWISLSPSSDIKITNNPLNTLHDKTKTNIIKSTIIYKKPIGT